MINNFKSLSKTYASTLQELEFVEQGSEKELNLLKAKELLEEIMEYMNSYRWLTKQSSKEKVSIWVNSGFDYDVLCEECGITNQTARQCICWANKQFKKKIGENTLRMIREGLIDEARAAFYVGMGVMSVEHFVNAECLEALPAPKYNIYSLADCENELEILRLISKARFQKYLDVMDEDKMAFVLWLLMGKSKKSDVFRPYLLSIVKDEMSAEELISMEDAIKQQQLLL